MERQEGFYNGKKLLSKKDLNNKDPEIYICDGTRTGGKTFYFKEQEMLLPLLEDPTEQFGIVVRHQNMAESMAEAFMSDLREIYYPHLTARLAKVGGGKVFRMFIIDNKKDKEIKAGYVLPLTSVEFIKINSAMFVELKKMFFDEFQKVDGRYSKTEVDDLVNIHVSVARGGGKHVRHVPLFMVANSYDLFNPYYIRMGVSTRLAVDTHFLRGDGWVMEKTDNEVAMKAISESGVVRALSNQSPEFAAGCKYMNSESYVVKALPNSAVPLFMLCNAGTKVEVWAGNFREGCQFYFRESVKEYKSFRKIGMEVDDLGDDVGQIISSQQKRQIISWIKNGYVKYIGMKSREAFFRIFPKFS